MEIPVIPSGSIPPDPVAPDSLTGIARLQTNPGRWDGQGWHAFVQALRKQKIEVREAKSSCSVYVTDGGGVAYGMPHGAVIAKSAQQIAAILKAAQRHRVPIKTRGGGLTTEGESVAYGGLLLDMTGMSRIVAIDEQNLTVRTEAGIYWHSLAEGLRRQ